MIEGILSYSEPLEALRIDTIESRRTQLCQKSDLKTAKKFYIWFAPNVSEVSTRSEKLPFQKINYRTRRFTKSPLPYLIDLLHTHVPTLKRLCKTAPPCESHSVEPIFARWFAKLLAVYLERGQSQDTQISRSRKKMGVGIVFFFVWVLLVQKNPHFCLFLLKWIWVYQLLLQKK